MGLLSTVKARLPVVSGIGSRLSFRLESVFLNSFLKTCSQSDTVFSIFLKLSLGKKDIGPGITRNGTMGRSAGNIRKAYVGLRPAIGV